MRTPLVSRSWTRAADRIVDPRHGCRSRCLADSEAWVKCPGERRPHALYLPASSLTPRCWRRWRCPSSWCSGSNATAGGCLLGQGEVASGVGSVSGCSISIRMSGSVSMLSCSSVHPAAPSPTTERCGGVPSHVTVVLVNGMRSPSNLSMCTLLLRAAVVVSLVPPTYQSADAVSAAAALGAAADALEHSDNSVKCSFGSRPCARTSRGSLRGAKLLRPAASAAPRRGGRCPPRSAPA